MTKNRNFTRRLKKAKSELNRDFRLFICEIIVITFMKIKFDILWHVR